MSAILDINELADGAPRAVETLGRVGHIIILNQKSPLHKVHLDTTNASNFDRCLR
jgi:hypothetical protein